MAVPRMAPPDKPRPQILFLDAYDSFTNNIVSLLTTLLNADVHVLSIDSPLLHLNEKSSGSQEAFRREVAHYHAVVCGPGPGSPEVEADVGLMRHVWALGEDEILPVLGICLGFQSLVLASGGKVRRLQKGLHGMVRDIRHQKDGFGTASGRDSSDFSDDGDIFRGVEPFKATLYHSLCADIGQDDIPETDWQQTGKCWAPLPGTPDLVPLAWVAEEREEERSEGGGVERILMSVKHRSKPFWGLQYHPESICTQPDGHAVIVNWFREAIKWNNMRGREVAPSGTNRSSLLLARDATKPSLLSQVKVSSKANSTLEGRRWTKGSSPLAAVGLDCDVISRAIPLPNGTRLKRSGVQVPDIVDALQSTESEHIILDSANADQTPAGSGIADVRGRYSIIALDVGEALRIEYHVGDNHATARIPSGGTGSPESKEVIPLGAEAHYQSIWHLTSEFLQQRRVSPADNAAELDLPFRGGFMGYVTYEMGLEGIDVDAPRSGHRRPDLCFVWVAKSIVVDHARGELHVQQLRQKGLNGDTSWIDSIVATLQSSRPWQRPDEAEEMTAPRFATPHRISAPDAKEYEDKVRTCQSYIAAGESYELCLTDQTEIELPGREPVVNGPGTEGHRGGGGGDEHGGTKGHREAVTPTSDGDTAWTLYRTLRTRQPSPFGSFLRLGGATLVSSSPERFLEYAPDADNATTLCSMRPMKGTVRKSPEVQTLSVAEKLLHVPKEEAENLMIVDLVRHDLHGVCGPGNVTVPHLMRVEEYASVFTMITVVEGRLDKSQNQNQNQNQSQDQGQSQSQSQSETQDTGYTGLDVLAASLPPGSMTGAPKKRSCELLQEIEGSRERSLYSGVVGYADVAGKGDWSVTIRTMFRWDDEAHDGKDVWRIGAGGAVTILSTPDGEREEMFTKLAGPLGVFGGK